MVSHDVLLIPRKFLDLSSKEIAGHLEEVQTERNYVTYPGILVPLFNVTVEGTHIGSDVPLYSVPIPTPEEDLYLGGKEALGGQGTHA